MKGLFTSISFTTLVLCFLLAPALTAAGNNQKTWFSFLEENLPWAATIMAMKHHTGRS